MVPSMAPLHVQAVDKMARTARRTVDTHVRHAISKPRLATTLRRMTAMFNFIPELREAPPYLPIMFSGG